MSIDFRQVFQRALPYDEFLQKYGTEDQRARWKQVYDATVITPEQAALLSSFRRQMNVLCMAGPWCGDCVNACPIFQRFAEGGGHSTEIDLRFINRDRDFEAAMKTAGDGASDVAVAKELSICGAPRVPVLLFMSEDGFECERYGERTLATYREKARKQLSGTQGASCPIGLAPEKQIHETNVAEWLTHFERVQWMLLTSPRLIRLHGEA
ncbi:MAG: thioredoxin family protein [Phycisphaerales bacterium]|nr:thioredoxin family protein [Phycisphaerales bacterium]